MKNIEVKFPLIEDITMDVANKYGMIQPGEADTQAVHRRQRSATSHRPVYRAGIACDDAASSSCRLITVLESAVVEAEGALSEALDMSQVMRGHEHRHAVIIEIIEQVEDFIGQACIDHVHLCLAIPPKYSVSSMVGHLKGKSAIKMFDLHSELKKRYWGRHFWAKGYCVSTIGLDEEQIRKYVRWQLKKDKTMDQLELWKKQ